MSECPHDLGERETACADGYCPICLAEQMTWQPIETAPKDGTPILVCDPGMEEPWTVRWQVGKRKQGWNHWTGFVSWKPTLWSPLLKPPASPSDIGR